MNKLDQQIILEAAEPSAGFALGKGGIVWTQIAGAGRCGLLSGHGDPVGGDPAWAAAGLAPGSVAVYIKQDAATVSTATWVSIDGGTTWLNSSVTGTPEFAYFFQTVADVTGTIAADNGKALFQTPSSNNTAGFTMVAASGDIAVLVAGVYRISWTLCAAEAGAMALYIGAVKQTASGSVYGNGATTSQNHGQALLVLAAGDIVSLRTDNCGAPLTLQLAGTTDTAQIVASIMFEKLSS